MKQFLHSLIVLMALAAAVQAFAQGQAQDKNTIALQQGVQPLVNQRCYTSGSDSNRSYLKVCITDNGNLSYFESPKGYVHLSDREGYAVCSGSEYNWDVHGFDVNIASDGWSPATISQPNG